MNPLALAKRQLFRQVWKCAAGGGAGTEAHFMGIRAFHVAAWECFAARKVDPPAQKAQYVFSTVQGDYHSKPVASRTAESPIDSRTRKAMLAVDRDCLFCWQELHRAIAAWPDGSRSKIRALENLSKWRKDYDRRWAHWLRRGNKKLPAKQQGIHDFAESHGRICFVAGEEKFFATAKEAQRYQQTTENYHTFTLAEQWYSSETNQRLMSLFDAALSDPDVWLRLEEALKEVKAEDLAAAETAEAATEKENEYAGHEEDSGNDGVSNL